MTKKIFPGNYVNHLSTYQGQPIVAWPGRLFFHKIGYIKVDATARREFDVIIPSPDKRPDDKPRPDLVGLTVPENAYLYHVGLRILDARKDVSKGTARSGLVWGNASDRIKLASAVSVNGAAITATTASTAPIDDTSLTAAPASSVFQAITPVKVTQNGGLTLKLYYDNGSTALGNAAGLTSNEPGGSFLIAEAAYFLEDAAADASAFGGLPGIVETL
jgi:hypothetical protein